MVLHKAVQKTHGNYLKEKYIAKIVEFAITIIQKFSSKFLGRWKIWIYKQNMSLIIITSSETLGSVQSSFLPVCFSRPLETIPKVTIAYDITIIFMFHSFFSSLARSRYLSIFSHSIIFTLFGLVWFGFMAYQPL